MQSGGSNNLVGFNNGANSVINSISCVEVGQDWSLGTGWSIGEDKAVKIMYVELTAYKTGSLILWVRTYKITY